MTQAGESAPTGLTRDAPLAPLPAAVSATRRQMFLDFCAALDTRGIAYVILAGHDGYPDRIDSDVDFMVSEADFKRLPALFVQPDIVPGARLIQFLRHETSACYYILASQVGERIAYLHPDSAASYRRRSRLWLHADAVIATRRKAPAGFWIPAPAVEFEYYFVKRVDKALIESRHLQRLAALRAEDPAGCQSVLDRLLPPPLRAPLTRAITAGDLAWLARKGDELRHALAAAPLRERPLARLASHAGEWLRRARRVLHPTGLVIAVLGPDGSGKTTVIEHLQRELAPAFRRVRRHHLRPHFGAVVGNTPVTNPHAQPPRGHLASTLKIALFLIDYWLGWLRSIYPARARSTLVIFDRYYHDMLADPTRYRLPRASLVPRWAAPLVPQPDLWLVLHAQPELLVARKGEITLDAARTLARRYDELARQLGASQVDTSGALDATLATALRIPLDFLAARTRQRLGAGQ